MLFEFILIVALAVICFIALFVTIKKLKKF